MFIQLPSNYVNNYLRNNVLKDYRDITKNMEK